MINGLSLAVIKFPSTTAGWLRLALGVAIAALVYGTYFIARMGGPIHSPYTWLVTHWSRVSNYSHGPLIPLIASALMWWNLSQARQSAGTDWKEYKLALGCCVAVMLLPTLTEGTAVYGWLNSVALNGVPFLLAWQAWALRKQFGALQAQPPRWGAAIVAGAMVMYYVGMKAAEAHTVVASFVLLLYGLVLALAGRPLFRALFFPIGFLLLMVPLNFLEEVVGFPLRMFVAKTATGILNFIGIEAVQRGTGILSAVFRFDVADPCSGIRSLMALTTVTAAYGYVTQRAQWKRWLLFLSAMPLAVLGNLARVISIALVAQAYGQELATKVYHDWSGFILFPVALGAMVIFGLLLNFNYRRVVEDWTKPVLPRVSHE